MKLRRDLKQYRDVENFANYELTNCFAYECAIRVDDVIKHVLDPKDGNSDFIYSEYGIGGEYWVNYHFFKKKYGYVYDDDHTVYTSSGGSFFQPGNYKIENTIRDTDGGCMNHSLRTNGISVHSQIFQGESFTDKYSIYQVPKRPRMWADLARREVDINIDMNLPLEEIQAFIEHFYRYQEKNRNIIASPFELLGGVTKKAALDVDNPKGPAPYRTKLILRDQKKIADMLFIYDVYKLGWTQTEIIKELKKHGYTYTDKPVKKYHEIAKEYIDNLKYRELLSGVSTK